MFPPVRPAEAPMPMHPSVLEPLPCCRILVLLPLVESFLFHCQDFCCIWLLTTTGFIFSLNCLPFFLPKMNIFIKKLGITCHKSMMSMNCYLKVRKKMSKVGGQRQTSSKLRLSSWLFRSIIIEGNLCLWVLQSRKHSRWSWVLNCVVGETPVQQ